jgi:hypothetical protein
MALTAHLYKVTHTESGRYYCGKHNGAEQNGYWGSGIQIRNMYKKYPKSAFTYQVMVVGDVDYIFDVEQNYVNEDMLKDPLCLNLARGGNGVRYLTEKQLKQCKPVKGRKLSEQARHNMSVAAYLRDPVKRSEESKRKTSEKLKGIKRGPMNAEQKQKMIESKKLSHVPKIWMHKDGIQTKIKLEDVELKLSEGWIRGRNNKHITEAYKAKMRDGALAQWQRVKEK